MTKHLKIAAIAAATMVALAHTPADAGRGQESKIALKTPPVTVSGTYSGFVRGTLSIGAETIVIPKKAVIMDNRGNKLEPGVSVAKRSLHVSGQMRDGKLVASFIVVGDPVSAKDFSETTLTDVEADPDRAR